MRRLALAVALVGMGCASHRIHTSPPAHPNESHILAETARFAAHLGVHAPAVITTRPYMVDASNPLVPGEKVPAAGRWVGGRIEYYRPVIQERDQAYGTALAAHEVAHAFYGDRDESGFVEVRAGMCAARLLAGETCGR